MIDKKSLPFKDIVSLDMSLGPMSLFYNLWTFCCHYGVMNSRELNDFDIYSMVGSISQCLQMF